MSHASIPIEGLVTCRAGLEKIVQQELRELEVKVVRRGNRAVFFESDLAGIYRLNMGIHAGLSVLVPIRSFNARNYDMLYFQSRKTNWHKLFSVDKSIRIDVKGKSDILRNSQYVVHRVKDGIVDTFRKLSNGIRPSINKSEPDIHIVTYIDRNRVTLCLDTSGIPLFKRGYRARHGAAPIKEDLAAGMLLRSSWDRKGPLLDPMCGTGTFLFEAWMLASQTAPNLNRHFAFQHTFDYDPELHQKEKEALAKRFIVPENFQATGYDIDESTAQIAREIKETYFSDAAIEIKTQDLREAAKIQGPSPFLISNPPYGKRIGDERAMERLYGDIGTFVQTQAIDSGSIYTANLDAAPAFSIPFTSKHTFYNGNLEGRLLCWT